MSKNRGQSPSRRFRRQGRNLKLTTNQANQINKLKFSKK
jgi:hypothetical protein